MPSHQQQLLLLLLAVACHVSVFVVVCESPPLLQVSSSNPQKRSVAGSSSTAVRDRYAERRVSASSAAGKRRRPGEPLEISANLTIEQIAHVLLQDYDNHHRPSLSGGDPTRVEINMYVQSFGSISVMDMDYSIDLLLRQKWVDPRLRFTGYQRTLSMSYLKERLWIPDLFFRNSKYGFLHEITTPNYLIWLGHDGTITFSQKLTVKLSCPMLLWNFPMDTQICPLEVGSYGFSLRDLEFVWMNRSSAPSVELNRQMLLNEFELPSVNSGSCQKSYNATGQFTCLFVEFTLVRKFGFYLIYTYLPSILIVTISWISFWIDYKAVPARITLGLLSILALMTQSAATMQKLPRVSYIKAIDVWLFACLAFVVGSLLEFALVNMLARRHEQRKLRDDLRKMMGREMRMLKGNFLHKRQHHQQQQNDTTAAAADAVVEATGTEGQQMQQMQQHDEASKQLLRCRSPGNSSENKKKEENNRRDKCCLQNNNTDSEDLDDGEHFRADKLDDIFVFAYPICFLAFNLVYWLTYMFWKTGTD